MSLILFYNSDALSSTDVNLPKGIYLSCTTLTCSLLCESWMTPVAQGTIALHTVFSNLDWYMQCSVSTCPMFGHNTAPTLQTPFLHHHVWLVPMPHMPYSSEVKSCALQHSKSAGKDTKKGWNSWHYRSHTQSLINIELILEENKIHKALE